MKSSSNTTRLSDLDLIEMIDDELQTLTLQGFDPWPGRYPLEIDEQHYKRKARRVTDPDLPTRCWQLAVSPIRLG